MSYLHVPRKTPFTGLTVGQQLYKAAETFGDKEMYVFYEDKERISFQQMKKKVCERTVFSSVQFFIDMQ